MLASSLTRVRSMCSLCSHLCVPGQIKAEKDCQAKLQATFDAHREQSDKKIEHLQAQIAAVSQQLADTQANWKLDVKRRTSLWSAKERKFETEHESLCRTPATT